MTNSNCDQEKSSTSLDVEKDADIEKDVGNSTTPNQSHDKSLISEVERTEKSSASDRETEK